MQSRRLLLSAAFAGSLLGAGFAQANLITNSDFGSGDLTGWTTFTTANGTLGHPGTPSVVSFDVTGSGTSNAARFQVGEQSFVNSGAGGGIFQLVNVGTAGVLIVSLNVAVIDTTTSGSNADWGTISLLVDNNVEDTVAFGSPPCCDVVRDTLSASVAVAAGAHEVRVVMTRPYMIGNGEGDTPFQYLDNIVADFRGTSTNVPEPHALAVLGLGLLGLASVRRFGAKS